MNVLAAFVGALMRKRHLIILRHKAADNRNETCILGRYRLDAPFESWIEDFFGRRRTLGILAEHRAMDVISQSDAHKSAQVGRDRSNVGVLRGLGQPKMTELVGGP